MTETELTIEVKPAEYTITLISEDVKEKIPKALVDQIAKKFAPSKIEWLFSDQVCTIVCNQKRVSRIIAAINAMFSLLVLIFIVQTFNQSLIAKEFPWSKFLFGIFALISFGTIHSIFHYQSLISKKKNMSSFLKEVILDHKIDCILQPHPAPPRKLLISDMDSTMIAQECIDELADFVGKKAQVAAITERAMNGELVFEEALRERVALLAGLPVATLQECFDTKITMMGGARELVAAVKAVGGKCVLVSGGFTFFTERVARELGFDEHYANELEIENGKLTGRVREPILGKEAKLAELHRQCKMLGIAPENVVAIGDGANDLPMLQAAGLGIAYHAKPSVQAQVSARINHNNLSAVIHLISA